MFDFSFPFPHPFSGQKRDPSRDGAHKAEKPAERPGTFVMSRSPLQNNKPFKSINLIFAKNKIIFIDLFYTIIINFPIGNL